MVACPACGHEPVAGARFCPQCGAALAEQRRRDARRTVTVVFSDLSGSTALGERLDAEALVGILSEYFETMRAVLERHGGTVAKFIGDAIMAVFGIPQPHEDDALRAVRAAAEMREAMASFNEDLDRRHGARLGVRTGVHTGEVFESAQDVGASLALGDPVNTAARLEQAAPVGEILLGPVTYTLVRDAVVVADAEPVAAKGKAEPIPVWRLVGVKDRSPGRTRRQDLPLVGRDAELATLLEAHAAASARGTCRTLCVVGDAGVGKSRLMAELTARVASGTRILVGRCLPYGEGITYWPIAEVVRSAAGIAESDDLEAARSKVAAIMGGAPDARGVAARLTEILGLSPPSGTAEEVPWAVRRLLEVLAADRTLLVVVDDLQWAEPGLLDLLEHVSDRTVGPVLLLALARRELFETHAGFAERLSAEVLQLEPLTRSDAAAVLAHLLGEGHLEERVVERLVEAAGGNPLFVEELVAMLVEEDRLGRRGDRWVVADEAISVPPSISAVLAARLDRLPSAERMTIQAASIVGQVFEAPAVEQLLAPEWRASTRHHLTGLVRRQLIHTADATDLDKDAYRFHHLLLRDEAYRGMAKAARAELHESYATWLEGVAAAKAGAYEAIIGYHFEQASRYRSELRSPTSADDDLAGRARGWLARAGRRSLEQGDAAAASNLLWRARNVARTDDPELLPQLLEALIQAGELKRAEVVADELEAIDREANPAIWARGAVTLYPVRAGGSDQWEEQTRHTLSDAISVLTQLDDAYGLAVAWHNVALLENDVGRPGDAEAACQRSADHARRAGNRRWEMMAHGLGAYAITEGPTPADDGIRRCAAMLERVRGDRVGEAMVGMARAALEAMRGDIAAARPRLARMRALVEDIGHRFLLSAFDQFGATIELLGGDPETATRLARRAYDDLRAMGAGPYVPEAAAFLAKALVERGGSDEEAVRMCEVAAGAPRGDRGPHITWRGVKARVLVSGGEVAEAEHLAREALALADATQWLNHQAAAALTLADVLRASGHHREAVATYRRSIERYDAKGNLVMSERVRRRASELSG